MLYVLLSVTIDKNLPLRLFCGYLPIHYHYLHAFMIFEYVESSYVKFNGHIILRLESGAIDSNARVAKSTLFVQICAFIGTEATHPA